MRTIKIGILGTSAIAPRSIIQPSKTIEGVKIWGVASRELNRAKAYANENSIPLSFGSYEELLDNKDINAVYIPLINSLHAEWTIKAIEAGKHVLVEKPCCLNSDDMNRIKETVLSNPDIIFLEGLMSRYHPWNDELLDIVKSEKYGKLLKIKTRACYNIDDFNDFRLFPDKGGSVFFEEGLLWCHITQYCLGLDPIGIHVNCDFNGPYGGDHEFDANLDYEGGLSSELFSSYAKPYEANHWVYFENADIFIRNFWRPTFGFVKMSFSITRDDTKQKEIRKFDAQNYYTNQLQYFTDLINKKKLNNFLNETIQRVELMERMFLLAKNQD